MNDPTRRAIRTLLQTSFAGGIIAMLAAFNVIDWTATQTVMVMAVITPIFGFVQNALEDGGQIPPILKTPVEL